MPTLDFNLATPSRPAERGFAVRTKTVTFYLTGFLLTMALCLAVIELTTRTGSWLMGKGFWLALHELEPYDQPVAGLYQWHPFTGITFKPNTTLVGSHPN